MKTLQEITESKRVLVGRTGIDGGSGEIHFALWKGTVVWSNGGGWEHVSVCPYKKRITPSWDDMCKIKEIFFRDDECVVQYHPPKSEYVNNMPNCLHLWRPLDQEMPMPPSIMVGIKAGQSIESALQEIAQLEAQIAEEAQP